MDLLQIARDWADPAAHFGAPSLAALVGWWLGRRKRKPAEDDPSAAQTNAITHRFDTLMDTYQDQIDGLVEEIARLRERIGDQDIETERHQGFGQ